MSFTFDFFQQEEGIGNVVRDVSINNNNIDSIDINSLEVVYLNNIDINTHQFIEFEVHSKRFYQSTNHYHSGLDEERDLVPGKYEGGYKLWECAIDLVKYLLQKESHTVLSSSSSNSNVLELGCGHGFPGITALRMGYKSVLFSDMNREVLEQTTWPNIIKNSNNNSNYNVNTCRCISGDWDLLSLGLQKGNYVDVPILFGLILSAETLYTSVHCRKVYEMLIKHLDVNGIALIATKRYYFGVGGGSLELEQTVKSCSNGQLAFSIIEVYEDGQSNIRELIQITKIF